MTAVTPDRDDTTLADLAARVSDLEDANVFIALRVISLERELRRLVGVVHECADDLRCGLEDGSREQIYDANWQLREATRSLLEDLRPAEAA